MKNIQLPQITLDRLLNLEVGESGYIIMPIDTKGISFNNQDENFTIVKAFDCVWCKGKDPNCTDCYGTGKIWDIDCESKDEFVNKYSPLQQGDEFYVGENKYKSAPTSGVTSLNIQNMNTLQIDIQADQMQPQQSRFCGTCLSVEVVKANKLWLNGASRITGIQDLGHNDPDSDSKLEVQCFYEVVVYQHNKLHNTNIIPSKDDNVFLIEVKRDK